MLEDVAQEWDAIMGEGVDPATFMQFEDRPGMNDDNEGLAGVN
jgi:hypothetical protein